MKRDYPQLFAILKKMRLTKEEAVLEYTAGRTDSLKALSDDEFADLMAIIKPFNSFPPGDSMRKKMIGIARSMNWGNSSVTIVPRLDNWLLKQKYKKKLMELTEPELRVMVTIFENQVYTAYLKALAK